MNLITGEKLSFEFCLINFYLYGIYPYDLSDRFYLNDILF